MPVARFQMPDGKIGRFEVPEGTTPEVAQSMIQKHVQDSAAQEKPRDSIPLDTVMRPNNLPPSMMKGVTDVVQPENDPAKMADFSTQVGASLPKDMEVRAQYFAKERFPNDPRAVSRYGVQDGRLFYMNDDGKMYFEEPSASLSPSEMAKYAGSSIGPSLPIAGSIGGGIASVTAGGVPGAVTGAAAGDALRQGMALAVIGKEAGFSPLQTAEEAAMGGIGQVPGAASVKYTNRKAVRDVAKTMTTEAKAAIEAIQKKAAEFGIDLTPAEITNLKSLKGQQNVLGDMTHSADTMADFYTKRNTEQVPAAVESVMGRISPIQSAEVGATSLKKGADDTIKAEMKIRANAAKPFYDASRDVPVSAGDYQYLMKDPFLAQQMRAVKANPKYQSDIGDLFPRDGKEIVSSSDSVHSAISGTQPKKITVAPADAKIGYLDVVKKHIDGMIEQAKVSGNKNDVRIYRNAKEKLTGVLDAASPDYAKARSIFEVGSPPVTALTKGEVGIVAKAGETNLQRVPRIMFESGPDSIKANRTAFEKAGKLDEWNDGLRSYLTDNFNTASKEFKTGNTSPGAAFRAKVFGTPKQKVAMQNAMSPEQWGGFNRLMDVLEATGRVPQGGSRTAFASEAMREMRDKSGGVVRKVIQPTRILQDLSNKYQDMKLGKYSENLAQIITSPDAMKQLKQLKTLPPNSAKAREIVSQVLSQYGFSVAGKPDDVQPGAFSNEPKNLQTGR